MSLNNIVNQYNINYKYQHPNDEVIAIIDGRYVYVADGNLSLCTQDIIGGNISGLHQDLSIIMNLANTNVIEDSQTRYMVLSDRLKLSKDVSIFERRNFKDSVTNINLGLFQYKSILQNQNESIVHEIKQNELMKKLQ